MSTQEYLDNIIDLIRTTNEVYFITAPKRVRTVFILVDDIIELALKSYLHIRASNEREACMFTLATAALLTTDKHRRQMKHYFDQEIDLPQLATGLGLSGLAATANLQVQLGAFEAKLLHHWTITKPDSFISFDKVVADVKNLHTGDAQIASLLERALERHQLRNEFYHDHTKLSFTIDDDKCLRALVDLFSLVEMLFSPEFHAALQDKKTVRCQIGVIRLKFDAQNSSELKEPYYQALKLFHRDLVFEDGIYEHNILHMRSDRFYATLADKFKNVIARLENRVAQLDKMRQLNEERKSERNDKLRQIAILSQQLEDIESLIR